MTPRAMLAAAAMLAGAWFAWRAAGALVAAFGLPFAGLLQQAALFVLALGLAERIIGRLAPSGDPHG